MHLSTVLKLESPDQILKFEEYKFEKAVNQLRDVEEEDYQRESEKSQGPPLKPHNSVVSKRKAALVERAFTLSS